MTRARINYVVRTDEKPYSYAFEPPHGTPWESAQYDAVQVDIADSRSSSPAPQLEREGFELQIAPSKVHDFYDADEVRNQYYAESLALALKATGGTHGYVFDHLVRRREANRSALSFGRSDKNGFAAANGRIHNDYTENSGLVRLGRVLPDESSASRISRFCIVNIWRSIGGPVLDTPLAVCDARTVSARELVATEVRYPRRNGEIYLLQASSAHRWHYFSKMDRHEVLIFKQYDSQISGVSRFTPHTAFDLPDIPSDAPLRTSIELRCLVVFEQLDSNHA